MTVCINRRKASQFPHEDILPIIILRSRPVIVFLKEGEKCGKEFLFKEDRTVHTIGILPAYLYVQNPPRFRNGKRPLFRLSFHKRCGIPGIRFNAVIEILPHPIVGGKDIEILSFHRFSCVIKRCQRILLGKFGIIEKLHTIEINEILKLLFQVSYDNGNLFDSHFMKLLNLSFNHPLRKDFQESFRTLIGQRHKAGTETGGKDKRAVYHIFHGKFLCFIRQKERRIVSFRKKVAFFGKRV